MIVFGWRGFPQYAARCVGAFVKVSKEPVVVVAPKPMVPIEGMEAVCSCPVYWVDRRHDFISQIRDFPIDEVSAIFVSGWGIPALDDLRRRVKARGGRVVMMSDHCLDHTFREFLSNVRFRLCFRRQFDRFFVPGKSGRARMRSFGVPDELIEEGVYSADASLFHDGAPLAEREKKIIYVGQFCERKNVKCLVQAFARTQAPGWSLNLYGSGPLQSELEQLIAQLTPKTISNPPISQPNNPPISQSPNQTIFLHSFAQPEQLAELYRSARLFCLPSVQENWGLVVHEAALSGCVLLLSDCIGSKDDLLCEGNGFEFDPQSIESMVQALQRAMSMTDEELDRAQTFSLKMSKNASLAKFVEGCRRLLS